MKKDQKKWVLYYDDDNIMLLWINWIDYDQLPLLFVAGMTILKQFHKDTI